MRVRRAGSKTGRGRAVEHPPRTVRSDRRDRVLRRRGGRPFQTGLLSLPRSTRPAFPGGRPRLESTRRAGRSKLPIAVFRPGRGRPQARPKFQSTRPPLEATAQGGEGCAPPGPEATRRRLLTATLSEVHTGLGVSVFTIAISPPHAPLPHKPEGPFQDRLSSRRSSRGWWANLSLTQDGPPSLGWPGRSESMELRTHITFLDSVYFLKHLTPEPTTPTMCAWLVPRRGAP